MIINKSRKFLLAMAMCLVLAACETEGSDSTKDSDQPSTSESLVNSGSSVGSQTQPSEPGSTEAPSSTKPDFTASWTTLPALGDEIKAYCGGNQIPFIDLQGDYHAVRVPKSATLAAHLLVYTTGSFDRTLVYNTKVTYELAGWSVSMDMNTLEMYAQDPETGIEIHFYGKENTRDGGYTPYLEVYYLEPFKSPESGAWSNATTSTLAEVGIAKPHMLPYCYLGTVSDTATKINTQIVEIKGGDWNSYETKIVTSVKNSLSSSRNWAYSKGTKITAYGKFPSEVHQFKKSFSDGYTLSCRLYGATDSYYYSSSSAVAEVFARLEVTVSAPGQ